MALSLSPSLPLSLSLLCIQTGPACALCAAGEHGLSIGGDVSLPALRIQTDLARGRCLPSHTYGDTSSLSAETDFQIKYVQLWDLTPQEADADTLDAALIGDEIAKSNREMARQADGMMLPFRTSMMMRVN